MKTLAIGIIGTGSMAGLHAGCFKKIKNVRLTACCDVIESRARAFAQKHDIPSVYTDYEEMLRKERLDGVTNVTVDSAHMDVALAAIDRGVAILSEKPLAVTLEQARKMAVAAKRAGVINMVNFSYRNSCGLQAAAKFIAQGRIGRVIHVESSYLQSWLASRVWGDWRTSPGLLWRLSTRHGSAGVLGDLGCHIYDLTTLLAGDIAELFCRLQTFDKGVKGNRMGEYVLDANDSFVSSVVFKNGAIGTIHSSRWATGQANSLRARVYGDKGAVEVDLDAGQDQYKVCQGSSVHKAEWKVVKCKPTPNNFERFIKSILTGKNDVNNFENGLKVQAYLHYSLASDKAGKPMAVKTG